MPKLIYKIALPVEHKIKLQKMISSGKHSSRVLTRARILLLSNEEQSDAEIAKALSVSHNTPGTVRKKYVTQSLDVAIEEPSRPGAEKILNDVEVKGVVALACTTPPVGRSTWTLDMLSKEMTNSLGKKVDRLVIWRTLKSQGIKPWREKNVVYTKDN